MAALRRSADRQALFRASSYGRRDHRPWPSWIEDFHARDALAFGIPAHRAGTGDVIPDAASWAGMQALRADPGMNNGVDNRDQS
ncbi:MAG: arginine decarboxylase [Solirubrobacteraceae bacterium]|jgi:hypothetical protein|nr:arginine decarboxylase [Solirubrobacteraceae bacterium]